MNANWGIFTLLPLALAALLGMGSAGCGRAPSSLLRQGRLPVYDFPLYLSDSGNGGETDGVIWKYEKDQTRTAFATGLNDPWGIAIDRYNNLYVVERGAGRLLKFNTVDGTSKIIATGLDTPSVVAVDSVGEPYVAQDTPHNVIRATDQKVIASHYTQPTALTFGVNDVMIVGDAGTNRLYWGAGTDASYATVETPVNASIDGMGRIYVAEGIASFARVRRYQQDAPLPDGGDIVADYLDNPQGIAVDPVGNVYILMKTRGIVIVDTSNVLYGFAESLSLANPNYLAFTQY